MGYAGHVWSHGLNPGPREADIRRIYGGTADASRLLAQHRIDFVVDQAAREGLCCERRFLLPLDADCRVVEGYRLYRVAAGGRP